MLGRGCPLVARRYRLAMGQAVTAVGGEQALQAGSGTGLMDGAMGDVADVDRARR